MDEMLTCLIVLIVTIGIHGHPARPDIPDNPKALEIFQKAEMNRVDDGYLTVSEMADIFSRFDMNHNGQIDETEFIAHWMELNLGDIDHAIALFHHADTDNDGNISQVPDYARLFYYFDGNSDNKISENEFAVGWYSLSA